MRAGMRNKEFCLRGLIDAEDMQSSQPYGNSPLNTEYGNETYHTPIYLPAI